jgi:tRNA 2-thiouridine synthesizing protein A
MAGPAGSSTPEAQLLDVRFHRCPLPVLRTRKTLADLPAGTLLTVLATDPAARIDMAHFCATEGHDLVSVTEENGVLRFAIMRG